MRRRETGEPSERRPPVPEMLRPGIPGGVVQSGPAGVLPGQEAAVGLPAAHYRQQPGQRNIPDVRASRSHREPPRFRQWSSLRPAWRQCVPGCTRR